MDPASDWKGFIDIAIGNIIHSLAVSSFDPPFDIIIYFWSPWYCNNHITSLHIVFDVICFTIDDHNLRFFHFQFNVIYNIQRNSIRKILMRSIIFDFCLAILLNTVFSSFYNTSLCHDTNTSSRTLVYFQELVASLSFHHFHHLKVTSQNLMFRLPHSKTLCLWTLWKKCCLSLLILKKEKAKY